MALLETKSLTKSFGALTAVDGVSLAVEAGALHSIIGPNGAGKTTLFNRHPGAPRRPPRHRALVPAHQRISRALAPRQRLDRRLRAQPVLVGPAVAAHRALSGAGFDRKKSPGRRGARGQGRPAGARHLARRAAPARARHR